MKFVYAIDKNNSFTLSSLLPVSAQHKNHTLGAPSPSSCRYTQPLRNKLFAIVFHDNGLKNTAKELASIATWVSV
jgi:hypothetical protein